ncbi:ER membrane protein complex subunit 7 homolog [Contarinia nasturtii]|uniref:ER membrane protein complex subunit 7 homolog n=1 Tax=Contarinia nasturtii TaxID=265458 RepID=UPI0012D3D8AF|nr:ER membrane protein complex subunit 7 homolog [Contarinia nasturtii]
MLLNKWKIVENHKLVLNIYFIVLCYFTSFIKCETLVEEYETNSGLYSIEGKVYAPEIYSINDFNWQRDTVITINNGEYSGFLKEDGTFALNGIPSGSYVVEVSNPDYYYESVRVEINPKGKFRARKLNYVQPSQVVQVPYPLKLKALTRFKYFQTREQWKITDFLFSPMILMMVLPLILMVILPRMMNDPETKKEMENMNLNKISSEMPEISEMITSFFTGGAKPIKKDDKSKSSSSKLSKKQRN